MSNLPCPIAGCPRQIHEILPTCFYHWRAAPLSLRTHIVHSYTPGTRQTKDFKEAVNDLIEWCNEHEMGRRSERLSPDA